MTTNHSRRTQPAIKVRLFPDERRALEINAHAARKPLSEFLLLAGLGATIKRVVDLEEVSNLAKVNADLGRLGGLLKMWLANDERFSQGYPSREEVTRLLADISETQARLFDTAGRILKAF